MDPENAAPSKILAGFAQGPDRLEAAIDGLSNESLDLALSSQSWSIRQIVHHLADGIDLWKGFIKQAIGCPGTSFSLSWYWETPQDDWARMWTYAGRPVGSSLALYRACHIQVVHLLEGAPHAWEHTLKVHFPNREEHALTVGDVVNMQMRHVNTHVEEIRKIRDNFRV